jgi:putative membrane protein
MKNTLSNQEKSRLDGRIAEVEKKTGAQIVLAVIKRSDSYAELPWKAFALAAAVAGLIVFLLDAQRPVWISSTTVLFAVAATLIAGSALALLTLWLPPLARLFLSAHRAEMEVHQHAEGLFLSRGMFATSRRTGILLLISLFEKRVYVLPDTGLRGCLNKEALEGIVMRMTVELSKGIVAVAFERGLDSLENILSATASAQTTTVNELPNEIIEEKGA